MLIGPSPIDYLASIHRKQTDVLDRFDRLSRGLPPRSKTIIPGIYHIYDEKHQLIYIGQSHDIYERMEWYQTHSSHQIWNHGATYVSLVVSIREDERLTLEKSLIKLYQPICNIQHNPRPNTALMGLAAARHPLPTTPLMKLSEYGTKPCLGNVKPSPNPLSRPLLSEAHRTGLGFLSPHTKKL